MAISTIFLALSVCFVSLLLAYDYFTGKRKERVAREKIEALESRLSELQSEENELRERIESKDKQLKQAFEDPVTGLPGWQVFIDRVAQSIKHGERHHIACAVMVVDIDDFSILNDAFGVDIGNQILKEVGIRVISVLRQMDSACRLGKDTFAILLGQVSKPESAVIAAQRILQAVSMPIAVKSYQLHLTSCVGLSLCPDDATAADTLVRNAEQALRAAKEKGRQTYQFYQDSMQARSQRELLLCTGLASESLFQELIIQYQPIMDVTNQSIVCMESSLCWQHPDLGRVESHELYQYADRQRKLNLITEWLLKHTCQKFIEWGSMGFKPGLLSIPLTVKQMENSNFIYRLSLVMQETGFSPENLLVEIRDNTALSSFDIMERSFNMLKYLDVKIGIGDFGFSAMTLRYLRSIKISYIKLENVLIDDINYNEREKSLVRSVIKFANEMSINVVAQGVETEEQVEALKGMGCTLMQGKLLGAIQTGDEVVESLGKHD